MVEAKKYEALNPFKELDGRLQRLRQALTPIEAGLIAELNDVAARLRIHSTFRRCTSDIHKAFEEAASDDLEANVTTFTASPDAGGESPSRTAISSSNRPRH